MERFSHWGAKRLTDATSEKSQKPRLTMAEWQSAETLARGRGKPQEIKGGGDNALDVRGAGTADGFRRLADDGFPRMA